MRNEPEITWSAGNRGDFACRTELTSNAAAGSTLSLSEAKKAPEAAGHNEAFFKLDLLARFELLDISEAKKIAEAAGQILQAYQAALGNAERTHLRGKK